jgi:carbamoyltransferase
MTAILGISAFYHDSAACLVVDGRIVAAAQEERFTRIKHDQRFPRNAMMYCLREADLTIDDIDMVGFYEKPLLKFERLLDTYVDYAPRGFRSFVEAIPLWMKEKLWLPDVIRTEIALAHGASNERAAKRTGAKYRFNLLFGHHHESHAASAFYPSPFEEAAILTMDGVGEWATSTYGTGRGSEVTLLREFRFPSSLGLLYSAFTYYTGFKINSGEYKVMGLAPYGEPRYVDTIREKLVDIRDDGSIRLNQDYFGYATTLRMTNDAFHRLLGGRPREPESPLRQRDLDLARSIQEITEEVMLKMARHVHRETSMTKLCMAGGVALNCVGNGRVLREGPFEEIWIQPAAGDAGGAVGVALSLWHRYLGNPRTSGESTGEWEPTAAAHGRLPRYRDEMNGAYLGPRHSDDEIEAFLRSRGARFHRIERAELAATIAELLANENVVGLHHGRMEFGPRALGARSILGDARSPKMQSAMNLKIKFRESFRPFAPSVQRECAGEWFDLDYESPYMLLVGYVKDSHRRQMTSQEEKLWGIDKLNVVRSSIPAVTHVDYSARIQTVRRETNPLYWEIIEEFRKRTGCPVIVNTSFNVRGEPIVCTPADSYRCFMRTNIDVLVLESFVIFKSEQEKADEDAEQWQREFQLD